MLSAFSAANYAGSVTSEETKTFCLAKSDHPLIVQEINTAQKTADGSDKFKNVGTISESMPFSCSRSNFTEYNTRMLLPATNGKSVFIKISPENETLDFEMLDQKEAKAKMKPLKAYLELGPSKKVQVFKEPGQTWKTNEISPSPAGGPTDKGQGLVVLQIDKDGNAFVDGDPEKKRILYFKDSKWVNNYISPLDHTNTPKGQLFYKVAVIPNTEDAEVEYALGQPVAGGLQGWVLGDLIRTTPLTSEAPVSEESIAAIDCQTCAAHDTKSLQDQIKKIKSQTEEKIQASKPQGKNADKSYTQEAKTKVTSSSCVKIDEVKKRAAGKNNLVQGFLSFLKQTFTKNKKNENKLPSDEQLASIDILARTMYGEMRSCHHNLGERYSQAQARIMVNRAENCLKEARQGKGCEFIGKERPLGAKDSLSKALVGILSHPNAVVAWNANDPNSKQLLCIPKDKIDQEIWHDVVGIATDAVINTEKFKQTTASVGENTVHYVSGDIQPKWSHKMKQVTGVKIGGLKVDKTNCIKMYSPKTAG